MKNKQAKRKICGTANSVNPIPHPFGYYFTKEGLHSCFMNGYGPDGYYEDTEQELYGVVSLTGKQIQTKQCTMCGVKNNDVERVIDPYFECVLGVEVMVNLCPLCLHQSNQDI